MHRIAPLLWLSVVVCGTGCVVHDRTGAPEPIWWPTFVVRESTLAPANGDLKVQAASPLLPSTSSDYPVGRFADRRFEAKKD